MIASDSTRLFDGLFSTPAMSALLGDRALVQGMLDVEAALARAEAGLGVVPAAAAHTIERQCRAEQYDLAALAASAVIDGNLAIPLLRQLTARVREADAAAAGYVHWGATSQDLIDTGLVLQLRGALAQLRGGLGQLVEASVALARTYRDTPMPGRTWLQQATPITFGLKAAGWLDALLRHRQRLDELQPRLLVLQFGGAAGTLSALGGDGLCVAAALAAELHLGLPDLPWHSQRDRIAEVGGWLAQLCGTLGKIGRDISLLMQTEVGEVLEPAAPGKGGSTAMPHKRNPVGCAVALAAATRAPGLAATLYAALPQEHERGLGNWPAEWDTLPELLRLTAASLAQINTVVAGLEVRPERMLQHLDANLGLGYAEAAMMRLAAALGRDEAHCLVERLSREALLQNRNLRQVLAADAQAGLLLDATALDAIFDPRNGLGSATAFVDRVLKRAAARQD
jgi:3-carboxy-cis,cis-muconate cycloisomerase